MAQDMLDKANKAFGAKKKKKATPPSEQLTGKTTFRTNQSDVAARKKRNEGRVVNDSSYGYGDKAATKRSNAINKADAKVDSDVTERYLRIKQSSGSKTAAGVAAKKKREAASKKKGK